MVCVMKNSIQAVVNEVIFKKEKNDQYFAVLSCLNEKKENVKISGIFPEDPSLIRGESLVFKGEFGLDSKDNVEFKMESFSSIESPLSVYLANYVGGISRRLARTISDNYTFEELDKLIKETPENLLKIKGVGQSTLEKITGTWAEYQYLKEIISEFRSYGLSSNQIVKIYETFGNDAVKRIKKNPYLLTSVNGFNFNSVDKISVNMGVKPHSSFRIRSGIRYALLTGLRDGGHTWLSKHDLKKRSIELLSSDEVKIEPELFDECLKELLDRGRLVEFENHVTTSAIFEKEQFVLKKLEECATHQSEYELTYEDIDEITSLLGFKPDGDQLKAISIGLSDTPIFTVSGYAGAGKTSIAEAILYLTQKKNNLPKDSIHCSALSGVASNRIKDATGHNASTIHYLLEADEFTFVRNEDNPIDKKVLVIDEASMIDLNLWEALLKAIDFSKTRVMVLGDPKQISPVGLGCIYKDILKEQLIPGVVLKNTYRTDKESKVLDVAEQIRDGEVPYQFTQNGHGYGFYDYDIKNKWDLKKKMSDLEYRQLIDGNNADIALKTASLYIDKSAHLRDLLSSGNRDFFLDYLKNQYLRETQVLCHMNKGEVGAENINLTIQSMVQENIMLTDFMDIGYGKRLYLYDKVIHLNNEMKEVMLPNGNKIDKKVMNGQMGIVFEVNDQEGMFTVYYPEEKYFTSYSKQDMSLDGNIDLGYAISIHKSQGAQFKNVVLPISWSYYSMFESSLLYTGITRVQQHLDVVGESSAFRKACQTLEEKERITFTSLSHKEIEPELTEEDYDDLFDFYH